MARFPRPRARRPGTPRRKFLRRIRARGESGFFRAMARGQIRTIRRRRIDGSGIEKPRHSEGGASYSMDDPSPDPRPGLISIASGWGVVALKLDRLSATRLAILSSAGSCGGTLLLDCDTAILRPAAGTSQVRRAHKKGPRH